LRRRVSIARIESQIASCARLESVPSCVRKIEEETVLSWLWRSVRPQGAARQGERAVHGYLVRPHPVRTL
jgi:hypothetical protein